jgi:predicted TIM-barrel fold metal-dependent hydrolase
MEFLIIDFHAHFPVALTCPGGRCQGRTPILGVVNINPLILQTAAKGFPAVNFIIPHFGAGYPRELLHLCWVCPNVHVDSSGNNEWVRWMPYPLILHDLFRKFYETIGPERILFATDSEWFPRGFANRYYETQWQVCCEIGMHPDDLHKVFHDNAGRLLHLVQP